MARFARERKPERVCEHCSHAGGWHDQTSAKEPRGKIGGHCHFPGCECGYPAASSLELRKGYAPAWPRPG